MKRHRIPRAPLGRSRLETSALCLGTWALSGAWGRQHAAEATDVIGRALDLGINFFDAAATYGDGEGEEQLARGLRNLPSHRRDDVVVATKGGLRAMRTADGRRHVERDSDPGFLRSSLIGSLRRLRLDHVDIYYVHWPDQNREQDEVAHAVRSFVDDGLVRAVGVSNFSAREMDRFDQATPIEVIQFPYNLLSREAEAEVIPYGRQLGAGLCGWSPLFHGLIAGALEPDHRFPADDWRGRDPRFTPARLEAMRRYLSPLRNRAADLGVTTAALALAWLIERGVTPVCGAQTAAQIEELSAAPALATEGAAADLDVLLGPPPRVRIEDGAGITSRRRAR